MSVWLITRCCRGIGVPLAEAVLASGQFLVATTQQPELLAGLTTRFGARVRILDFDPAGAPTAVVAHAIEAFGRLDVLVNQAGSGRISSIENTSLADFRWQLDRDLLGHVALTKAAIPPMRAQRSGRIIHLSIAAGRCSPAGRAGPAMMLRGLEAFSEALAHEVRPLGIKVTTVVSGEGEITEESIDRGEEGQWERIAGAILQVAKLAEPPLHLVLGRAALRSIARDRLARIESDRQWRDLSLSTDRPVETTVPLAPTEPVIPSTMIPEPAPSQLLATRLPLRVNATTAPRAAQAEQTTSAM